MLRRILAVIGGLAFLYFGIFEGLIQGEITWTQRSRSGMSRREPIHLSGQDARIFGGILTVAGAGFLLLGLNPKALRMVKKEENYWD